MTDREMPPGGEVAWGILYFALVGTGLEPLHSTLSCPGGRPELVPPGPHSCVKWSASHVGYALGTWITAYPPRASWAPPKL